MGGGDPIDQTRTLATLAGPARLRDQDVPFDDLPAVSEAAAERPPAKANPRPAPAGAILELLQSVW
jgi:alcohol dehydrogenase class IV